MNERAKVYQGILTIVVGFLIFYFIFKVQWLLYFILAVGLLGLISFALAKKLFGFWMKIAQGLGWVNTRVLLSIVFFLFLTPLALVYRMLNKSTIQKSPSPEATTFYETKDHTFSKADLEKMW